MAHRVPFVVAELGADVDPFVLHLFAALAEKERALELTSVRDALEEEDRDPRLPRPRGQGKKRFLVAARQLFQHGPDGGILEVVAAGDSRLKPIVCS